MTKLYLVDGSAYIFRAFYAINANLSNQEGLPTNALYGFVSMIRRLLEEEKPTHLCVVLDPFKKDSVNFRKELYPEYKANRSQMPEDLSRQIPYFTQILEALSIHHCAIDHHEADDVIATLTKKALENNTFVTIVSSDKDLMQLIDDKNVSMVDTMKGLHFDVSSVIEKFGVPPEKVKYVQALAGDSSDNIPGVPGIGLKTGGQLIAEFGDLETLLSNIDRVSGTKRKENLREFADQARLSLELATLRDNCNINFELDKYEVAPPNIEELTELFDYLGFRKPLGEIKSWMKERGWEVPGGGAAKKQVKVDKPILKEEQSSDLRRSLTEISKKPATYRTIDTVEAFEEVVAQLDKAIEAGEFVSFDLETTSLNPLVAEIVGLSFSWEDRQGVYLPVGHRGLMIVPQLNLELVLERLRPYWEKEKPIFTVQNGKYEWSVLHRYHIDFKSIAWDTMLVSYLLDPAPDDRSHGLDTMAKRYFGYQTITYEDVAGKGTKQKSFDEISIEAATTYAAEDADITRLIAKCIVPELEAIPELLHLYKTMELPLLYVLARMEITGIEINKEMMGELAKEFEEELVNFQNEINEIAGEELNPNSPKQLREILFDRLELPVIKRTKTGPSTDASVLEELAPTHPLPQLILDYRSVAKLKGTYVDALPTLVQKDGRLHTSFNQAATSTGRLSSSNPNLQNIPVRSERGQSIRRAFVPAKGSLLICADYSQIELRIMAHMSEDPKLLHAYREGIDIHRLTASEIFEVAIEEVTPEQRRAAKTINFGLMYGMGPQMLSKRLGISRNEAKTYIDAYFARYAGVDSFFKQLVEKARRLGYAETLFGRRCYLPGLQGKGRDRAFSERVAVNAPIQGTSADIIKAAMVELDRAIDKQPYKIQQLLQIHDELIVEVDEAYAEEGGSLVKEAMESVIKLKVPLTVELGIGPNWLDAK